MAAWDGLCVCASVCVLSSRVHESSECGQLHSTALPAAVCDARTATRRVLSASPPPHSQQLPTCAHCRAGEMGRCAVCGRQRGDAAASPFSACRRVEEHASCCSAPCRVCAAPLLRVLLACCWAWRLRVVFTAHRTLPAYTMRVEHAIGRTVSQHVEPLREARCAEQLLPRRPQRPARQSGNTAVQRVRPKVAPLRQSLCGRAAAVCAQSPHSGRLPGRKT